jgi:hypothetical protein
MSHLAHTRPTEILSQAEFIHVFQVRLFRSSPWVIFTLKTLYFVLTIVSMIYWSYFLFGELM